MTNTLVAKTFAVHIIIHDYDTRKTYDDEYIVKTYAREGAIEVAKRRAYFDYPVSCGVLDVDYAYEIKR